MTDICQKYCFELLIKSFSPTIIFFSRLSSLTIREYEYLSWLRANDLALFGSILNELKKEKDPTVFSRHVDTVHGADEIYHERPYR